MPRSGAAPSPQPPPAGLAKRAVRRTVGAWGRRHHLAELRRLERAPWDDPAAMDRERLRLLRETVVLASSRSPFYRQLLGGSPRLPERIEDLGLLPTSTKADILATGLDRAVQRRLPVHRDVWRTSGTSGEPYVYRIDPWYGDRHMAQRAFVYLRAGVPRGARIVEIGPGWRRVHGDTFVYPTFCRTQVGYRRDDILEVVRAVEPTLLYGNCSDLLRLVGQVEASGRPLHVPFVCSSSELLRHQDELLLRRVLGSEVFEVYGSSEGGNVAWRRSGETTWSVLEPRVVVEVLDAAGRPVEGGGTGEIVITTLTEQTSPLIRYRTGDLAAVPDGRTATGESGLRLASLEGRVTDLVVDHRGRGVAFPVVMSHGVFASDEAARHVRRWKVHQYADRSVEVRVQLAPGGELASVSEAFVAHLVSVLGPLPVTVVAVEHIDARPGEKFRSLTSDAVVGLDPEPGLARIGGHE